MKDGINKLFLAGFMTCGKSTIGPILANVFGWQFYDLDRVIEAEAGITIVEIFEKHGDEFFRNLETNCLKKLCKEKNVVISLGGGTMASEDNIEIMKNAGKIAYLHVSPNVVYSRIKNKIDRPLFRDLVLGENPEKDFIKRINDIYNERKEYYQQADFVFDTNSVKVGQTVDEIANKLKKYINEDN